MSLCYLCEDRRHGAPYHASGGQPLCKACHALWCDNDPKDTLEMPALPPVTDGEWTMVS